MASNTDQYCDDKCIDCSLIKMIVPPKTEHINANERDGRLWPRCLSQKRRIVCQKPGTRVPAKPLPKLLPYVAHRCVSSTDPPREAKSIAVVTAVHQLGRGDLPPGRPRACKSGATKMVGSV